MNKVKMKPTTLGVIIDQLQLQNKSLAQALSEIELKKISREKVRLYFEAFFYFIPPPIALA